MKLCTSSWMVLITLLILTTVRWWDPTPVQRLRLLNFDVYQALLEKTTSDKIVLYDIGEEFLKEHGQWPPNRTVFAQLTADLYNAGAGLVVFFSSLSSFLSSASTFATKSSFLLCCNCSIDSI